MRVALVCDWFLPRRGGIELHLRDLALALRARGADVRVVTTTPGAAEVDGVPVHRVRSLLAPRAGFALSPTLRVRIGDYLRAERIDVVHAHASVVSPAAYAGALAGALAELPTVLTFHSMLHGSAVLLGASEALLGWARGRVLLSAVSSVVAAQAARWMPGADVAVLPNGVDVEFWRAAPASPSPSAPVTGAHPPAADARHDRAGEVAFVAAMRLSRKKRPLALVRAFAETARFVAGSPAVTLTIAGEGPLRDATLRLAAELGVGGCVHLPGMLTRDALRALHARSHVFVLPSERESFGLAALEARAAGLPVVAMLAGGARDFIAPGVNGILVPRSADLARALARFAVDTPFRRSVAQHNRTTPPLYDWPAVAAMHLRHYAAAGALARAG